MVCPPAVWDFEGRDDSDSMDAPLFDELKGGYLTWEGGYLMYHYRLLTSNDYDHFYVRFNNKRTSLEWCILLSEIKYVPYKVNKVMLDLIINHQDDLEKAGLLELSFLAKVNPASVWDEIMLLLSSDEFQNTNWTFGSISQLLDKRIQDARYEQLLIQIAKAYNDYKIDFPAFIDFRGCIYRSGILHFHERDLARSLIMFDSEPPSSFHIKESDLD